MSAPRTPRVIKFRTWSKESKNFIGPWEFIGSDQILTAKRSPTFYQDTLYSYHSVEAADKHREENFVLQQCTGIKAEGDTSIYEGDYVKVIKNNCNSIAVICKPELLNYSQAEVRWLGGGFVLTQKGQGWMPLREFSECDCCPSILAVIGNIFENPELSEVMPTPEKLNESDGQTP